MQNIGKYDSLSITIHLDCHSDSIFILYLYNLPVAVSIEFISYDCSSCAMYILFLLNASMLFFVFIIDILLGNDKAVTQSCALH